MSKRTKPQESAPVEVWRIRALAEEIAECEKQIALEKLQLKANYVDVGVMMTRLRMKAGISRRAASGLMGVSENLVRLMEAGSTHHYTHKHRHAFFTKVLKTSF